MENYGVVFKGKSRAHITVKSFSEYEVVAADIIKEEGDISTQTPNIFTKEEGWSWKLYDHLKDVVDFWCKMQEIFTAH